ncbi:putative bifunctional diguanylate cyclase/phosphodiesterase [Kineosporia succinea]|uniref:Diguanylate cyclase (GGDEF)-like protein n=1 Tax=Kineosporia succinea TaxID=84632 RepID=A0ABT9PDL1_9ACTN|nr:bifunctional diguanylate cyclase/phosphodiesterase [Kineosporia succinea]MDP9830785.1 diguanylate cyclase (GGDEF)-like protein [Kineosporia succinea]
MEIGCGVLAAVLLAVAVRLLVVRTGTGENFRRWILGAVSVIAAAGLVASGLDVLGLPGAALVFPLGAGLGCLGLYHALILWMQAFTGTRATSENANTAGALLVVMAMGNLAGSGSGLWQLQAGLFAAGAAVVALGASLWIAVQAGLTGDRPMRVTVLAAITFAVTGSLALVFPEAARTAIVPAWLLGALVLAAPAARPGNVPRSGAAVALNRPSIYGSLLVLAAGLVTLAVQAVVRGESGGVVVVLVTGGVLLAGHRMVAMVGDLTDLTRTRQEALTDELTGVANRRSFLAAVDTAVELGGPVSLLIIDLDRFKEVNDRYGHATGDELLRHVTRAFTRRLPPHARLARLGGDEFAVLVEDTSLIPAVGVAEQLLEALTPLRQDGPGGRALEVGASIGVARLEPGLMDAGELLRRADVAMYQAKVAGLGVRAYDRGLDTAVRERRQLLEELRVALHPDAPEQIVVHFQPQVDAWSGEVVGAEALVRWQHPRLGLLYPDRFLDLAEEHGLMPALTHRVLHSAVASSRDWREEGRELRVSVNLSPSCLTDPRLLPTIDALLLDGEIRPDELMLEVTETSLMTNQDEALAALRAISRRGVGLSIDDYGTGFSSLSYMNILPATELKIDRSFTVRVVEDERTAAIVAGTAELAHRLGMRLVAEGTEDVAALHRVRELGCDISQGYLHSRPLAPPAFREWLGRQRAEAAV